MKKDKIIKYTGVGVVCLSLMGSGLSILETSINHNEKICPFVTIFGVDHQINAINDDINNQNEGIYASYVENEIDTTITDPIYIKHSDGTEVYYAPLGCKLKIIDDKIMSVHEENVDPSYNNSVLVKQNGEIKKVLKIKEGI